MDFVLKFSRTWIFYMCLRVLGIKTQLVYNTLESVIIKTTTYNPQVKEKTCLLVPDEGPCRAGIYMYYFEPSIQNCSMFKWGGCQGNGNRFDNFSDCITNCLTQPNPPPKRPRWCSLTFDYGFCFGAQKVWYYDPIWKVCKERIYSGCGGNKNNFYNKEQCAKVCIYGTYKYDSSEKCLTTKRQLIINPWQATKKTTTTKQYRRSTISKRQLIVDPS